MKTAVAVTLFCCLLCGSWILAHGQGAASKGYVLERDNEVAKIEPGPHQGLGKSTGYSFFSKVTDFKLVFRKRVLHPGASIGYHKQEKFEVYYFTGGTGKMTINGQEFLVQAGDATLTFPGSSHGVVQTGDQDLTIMIAYEK